MGPNSSCVFPPPHLRAPHLRTPNQAEALSRRAAQFSSSPLPPAQFTQQLPRPVMTGRHDGAIAITLDRSNKVGLGSHEESGSAEAWPKASRGRI
jgi:hypothetical protein